MGAIEQRYVLSNLLHLLPASSLRPPFLDVHRALHLDRKMPTPAPVAGSTAGSGQQL
jgi:hypothetical protein